MTVTITLNKWVEKILPFSDFHRKETAPRSSWKRKQFVKWLTDNNIAFSAEATVKDLWELCKAELTKDPLYALDEYAASKGVEILRLPPFHCKW